MLKLSVGDIVICKNSHESCGYRRGDKIRVVRRVGGSDFIGQNLTTPDNYGMRYVYMGPHIRYNIINEQQATIVFKLLKWVITIHKIRG